MYLNLQTFNCFGLFFSYNAKKPSVSFTIENKSLLSPENKQQNFLYPGYLLDNLKTKRTDRTVFLSL